MLLLELSLATGLGLLLLAFTAGQQLRLMRRLTADWSQLSALLGLKLGGGPLGAEIVRFFSWQVALHVCFGLIAWGFAWLTVRAFALAPDRRWRLTLGWFVAGVTWLFIANATLFPWSATGLPADWLRVPLVGEARLLELVSLALCAAVLVVAARTLASFGVRVTSSRIFAYSLIGVLLLLLPYGFAARDEAATNPDGKPNLVIIGIDSLRNDVVGAGRTPGLTPNIDAFVRDEAQLFPDAVTPLGRTYPAWVSILTSRHPRSTGARENLVAREALRPFVTLADVLRENGYHTVYATDEVRFSNIDASYGFEQVITPTMGAADFLLGKANDLPLSNLFSNTWLARKLFPATYGNRAASVTYRPETFVEWLDAEIEPRGPTMLAIHLTLPHHPFTWAAGDPVFERTDLAYRYANSVIAVDRQFGKVMEVLERKGLLNEAIVVLLSDHGEALGLPESDALIRGETVRRLLDGQRISLWGHGTSVLSPQQYSAFLALRGFGSVDLPRARREYDAPATLLDVAPTALELLGLRGPDEFEGLSLLPVIRGREGAADSFAARVRFTETGISTTRMVQGDFDERSLLGEAAGFFRLNAGTGRFELREEILPAILATKERAAIGKDWLLAAIPGKREATTHKYVLLSRDGREARRLEGEPAQDDTEAVTLWRALHAHYGEELLPPAARNPDVVATAE